MVVDRQKRHLRVVHAAFAVNTASLAATLDVDPTFAKGCWHALRAFHRCRLLATGEDGRERDNSVIRWLFDIHENVPVSVLVDRHRVRCNSSQFVGAPSDEIIVQAVVAVHRLHLQPVLSQRSKRKREEKGIMAKSRFLHTMRTRRSRPVAELADALDCDVGNLQSRKDCFDCETLFFIFSSNRTEWKWCFPEGFLVAFPPCSQCSLVCSPSVVLPMTADCCWTSLLPKCSSTLTLLLPCSLFFYLKLSFEEASACENPAFPPLLWPKCLTDLVACQLAGCLLGGSCKLAWPCVSTIAREKGARGVWRVPD